MAVLVTAITPSFASRKTWMAVTSTAMTADGLVNKILEDLGLK